MNPGARLGALLFALIALIFTRPSSAALLRRQYDADSADFRGDALSVPPAQAPPRAADSALEWCGTPDDIFTLSSLVITPDPPEKGANLTVRVEGYLKETIVAGSYADVTVKIGVIKLLDTRLDLCEQGKDLIEEECPLQPGERVLEKTVEIPGLAPKVDVKVAFDFIQTKSLYLVEGPIVVSFFEWPPNRFFPSQGKYKVTAVLRNADDKQIACVNGAWEW